MEFSIAGALICGVILLLSRFSAEPPIFALITSLAFGSTAIVILPALGGSSPIIYVVFLGLLLATVALHSNAVSEIGAVFQRQPTAWVVLFLILYAAAGAIVLPRMFAGQTTVFVTLRDEGRMGEIPLMPVSGNITQALYFVLGALSYFAFSVLLVKPRAIVAVRQGFFTWATLHVGMGLIDLGAKLSGLGDILAPIRTASYVMLTDVAVAGFSRIAGAYSEASAFGATSVALLAFSFTYWRGSRSRYAFVLTVLLFILLVLSTSSTAYAGGGVLGFMLVLFVVGAALRNRLVSTDILLMAGAFIGITAIVGIVLFNEQALDPYWRLFDAMVLNKASSASALERGHWNYMSLQSALDTGGLGIGLGSSRASSWIIAVVSQLGFIGTLLIGVLLVQILRAPRSLRSAGLEPEDLTTALSVRAAALGALIAASIADGSANPGIVFFIALATMALPRLQSLSRLAPRPIALPFAAQLGAHSSLRT